MLDRVRKLATPANGFLSGNEILYGTDPVISTVMRPTDTDRASIGISEAERGGLAALATGNFGIISQSATAHQLPSWCPRPSALPPRLR
jgi:hypothetical protein